MSSSNPPNPNTPPVFNNDAFGTTHSVIDTAYLNANYLRFPTAQGTEIFSTIDVNYIQSATTQTIVQSSLLIEQPSYPPTAFTALGYTDSYSPYVYNVNPYVATTPNDDIGLLGLVNINYKGVYLITLTTFYSSPTTATIRNQSCYLSTDTLSNTKTLGVELNNQSVSVSATGLQVVTTATGVINCPNNFNSFYTWIRNNTSGAYQEIGITITWTKIG